MEKITLKQAIKKDRLMIYIIKKALNISFQMTLNGYQNYPELKVLDQIAKKFLQKFRDPKIQIQE